jgi:hypothetical protein
MLGSILTSLVSITAPAHRPSLIIVQLMPCSEPKVSAVNLSFTFALLRDYRKLYVLCHGHVNDVRRGDTLRLSVYSNLLYNISV